MRPRHVRDEVFHSQPRDFQPVSKHENLPQHKSLDRRDVEDEEMRKKPTVRKRRGRKGNGGRRRREPRHAVAHDSAVFQDSNRGQGHSVMETVSSPAIRAGVLAGLLVMAVAGVSRADYITYKTDAGHTVTSQGDIIGRGTMPSGRHKGEKFLLFQTKTGTEVITEGQMAPDGYVPEKQPVTEGVTARTPEVNIERKNSNEPAKASTTETEATTPAREDAPREPSTGGGKSLPEPPPNAGRIGHTGPSTTTPPNTARIEHSGPMTARPAEAVTDAEAEKSPMMELTIPVQGVYIEYGRAWEVDNRNIYTIVPSSPGRIRLEEGAEVHNINRPTRGRGRTIAVDVPAGSEVTRDGVTVKFKDDMNGLKLDVGDSVRFSRPVDQNVDQGWGIRYPKKEEREGTTTIPAGWGVGLSRTGTAIDVDVPVDAELKVPDLSEACLGRWKAADPKDGRKLEFRMGEDEKIGGTYMNGYSIYDVGSDNDEFSFRSDMQTYTWNVKGRFLSSDRMEIRTYKSKDRTESVQETIVFERM